MCRKKDRREKERERKRERDASKRFFIITVNQSDPCYQITSSSLRTFDLINVNEENEFRMLC